MIPTIDLFDRHDGLKLQRFRGSEMPPQLAAMSYLKSLEAELEAVRQTLDYAWSVVDLKDFRKCSRHMDHAQQRLHQIIKKLARKI